METKPPDVVLVDFDGLRSRGVDQISPDDGANPGKKRRGRRGPVEENLTTAQVLEKYDDGPDTGLFTDGSASPNPARG